MPRCAPKDFSKSPVWWKEVSKSMRELDQREITYIKDFLWAIFPYNFNIIWIITVLGPEA
jgi:hypothetical protein